MTSAGEKGQIAKKASVVGGSTLLSRLAGLARDQVTSYFFGTVGPIEAFVVAFRIPNLFRRLLAEGAFTAAFVPVFTAALAEGGQPAAAALFKKVFTLLALALAALSLAGVIFAPAIVSLMAPGFRADPEQFRLTVFLARLLFPYIFFMGLGALFMGALNSCGYFAAPALGPFMGNLAMIGGTALLFHRLDMPIMGLAIGAMAGGLMQLAIQLPGLRRAGLKLRPDFNFRAPGVKKILLLMGPATLGAAVYQVSIFINTILASYLPDGSLPFLYYADRLMQFPLGVFSVALGVAALPTLARQSALGDRAGFIDSARFALGLSFFITIPAAMGLTVMALPLVTFLFQRGNFTELSSLGTAVALQAFVLGLPFLSGSGLLARVFYSRSDTRTPTRVAMGSLATGAGAAFILMWPLQHMGLALASSIASVVNFFWLYGKLLAGEAEFPHRDFLCEVLSYVLLAAVMGLAVWPLRAWAMNSGSFVLLAAKTLASVGVGVLLYFGLSLATKRPHAVSVLNLLRRRFKK
jgi:putative peptidoglycan lipid II flippase